LLIDLKALIARPGIRVNCEICGEEILNQREVILDGKALCRGCADGGYVRCMADFAKRRKLCGGGIPEAGSLPIGITKPMVS
jgi:hypothetical protein